MQAIGSSNEWYNVVVRGMKNPIRMTADGGAALSKYLESEPSPFVHIKNIEGAEYTIRTMTIDRVEKGKAARDVYKTVTELNMPDLSR